MLSRNATDSEGALHCAAHPTLGEVLRYSWGLWLRWVRGRTPEMEECWRPLQEHHERGAACLCDQSSLQRHAVLQRYPQEQTKTGEQKGEGSLGRARRGRGRGCVSVLKTGEDSPLD